MNSRLVTPRFQDVNMGDVVLPAGLASADSTPPGLSAASLAAASQVFAEFDRIRASTENLLHVDPHAAAAQTQLLEELNGAGLELRLKGHLSALEATMRDMSAGRSRSASGATAPAGGDSSDSRIFGGSLPKSAGDYYGGGGGAYSGASTVPAASSGDLVMRDPPSFHDRDAPTTLVSGINRADYASGKYEAPPDDFSSHLYYRSIFDDSVSGRTGESIKEREPTRTRSVSPFARYEEKMATVEANLAGIESADQLVHLHRHNMSELDRLQRRMLGQQPEAARSSQSSSVVVGKPVPEGMHVVGGGFPVRGRVEEHYLSPSPRRKQGPDYEDAVAQLLEDASPTRLRGTLDRQYLSPDFASRTFVGGAFAGGTFFGGGAFPSLVSQESAAAGQPMNLSTESALFQQFGLGANQFGRGPSSSSALPVFPLSSDPVCGEYEHVTPCVRTELVDRVHVRGGGAVNCQ